MPVNEKDMALSLTERKDALRLYAKPGTLRNNEHPAFAGRRIRHKNWTFMAAMEFLPKAANESAGIVIFQNENWHYRFEISLNTLKIIRAAGKEDEVIFTGPITNNESQIVLAVGCADMKLAFFTGKDQHSLKPFYKNDSVTAHILSTEHAGGFVGTLAGVFATSNWKESSNYADVLWAEYKEISC